MGIQKIEIGDIFEVPTAIGNAYIQYMAEVDQTTLIRLLPGVYHEPVDLEKLVQQKERYICFVPLGIALRRKYIRKVGFSEVKKFKVPKYFKDVEKVCGVFKGWEITNIQNNEWNCLRYSGNGPYCKLYRFSQGRDTETHKTGAFHAAGK